MSGISYYQVSFEILFHRLTAAAAASLMKLDQHLFFSSYCRKPHKAHKAHKSSSNFFAYKRLIYCRKS